MKEEAGREARFRCYCATQNVSGWYMPKTGQFDVDRGPVPIGAPDPNTDAVSWGAPAAGVTGEDGRAVLEATPGTYLVAARGPGRAPAWAEVTRPSGEARTRVRLQLEAGDALSGRTRVRGTGEALPLVELELTYHARALEPWQRLAAPADERVYARSDERGRFRLEGLTPGLWRLEARAPGHARAQLPAVRVPASGEVEVALSAAGVLEGFVARADGTPAAGARVLAAGEGTPVETTTGEGGGFSLEVDAGAYDVSARRGDEPAAL